MGKNSWIVDFEPIGKRIEVEEGKSILEAARLAGIKIIATCGGAGTCRQCKIQVISDNEEFKDTNQGTSSTEESLLTGWGLACQIYIKQSAKIFIPPESLTTQQRLQVESKLGNLLYKTNYSLYEYSIKTKDILFLKQSKSIKKNLSQLKKYDEKNHKDFFSVLENALLTKREKLIFLKKKNRAIDYYCDIQTVFGIAVDLGTTKIAAYLVDLISGRTITTSSAMNPQISYGEDIISRILYCTEESDGSSKLKNLVIETINNLCKQMCEEIGIEQSLIIEVVIVGNTAMHHLAIGLPVKQLGLSPYLPSEINSLYFKAIDIGLNISPRGGVYFPENIAGYVGGDHVAMMIATGAYKAEDNVIAIDIGTNSEISLVNKGKIYTCSCASGPAFEGAHIKDGMRAAEGAIERVKIINDEVQFQTIGSVIPTGICGSGILDSIAELKENEIIDGRGRFDSTRKNIRGVGKDQEFILVHGGGKGKYKDIVITRKDVNEILLAKAAIQSGILILLKTAGLSINEIDRVIVAGAFGSYLDVENAIKIGLFPKLPVERFSQVGNAAGSGAKQMLISDKVRELGKEFSETSEYIELTLFSDFQKIYLNSLKFTEFDYSI